MQRRGFSLIDQKLSKLQGLELRRIWDILGYLHNTLSAALWFEAFVIGFWNFPTVKEYILQMCNVEVSVWSIKNKTIVDCISPAPTLDLVTRGAAPCHTGSNSSFFFLYKLFKMYYFCEIEKVSKCLKCKVLLLKRKTKSHKTTKRKHVILLVTIDGLPEKLKH